MQRRFAITLAGLGLAFAMPMAAFADSCWNHNGSLMRLKASGNQRWFYYEAPKAGMAQAGVTSGTLLFEGSKNGNWYSGTSRVFSKFCPGSALVYEVAGPVRADQLQVTLTGERQINVECHPTGNYTTDTLVFTYAYEC